MLLQLRRGQGGVVLLLIVLAAIVAGLAIGSARQAERPATFDERCPSAPSAGNSERRNVALRVVSTGLSDLR
jgi:hypothetical protein